MDWDIPLCIVVIVCLLSWFAAACIDENREDRMYIQCLKDPNVPNKDFCEKYVNPENRHNFK